MDIGIPAYEQVRGILRDEIISGVIPPETHLTILDTAKRFGVSHMPIREAFQWLQGEGLLTVLPHRGARVLSLTSDYVRDIYELRSVIAGLLARQSIAYLKPAGLARIDRIHRQFCDASELKDLTRLLALNTSFHEQIYGLGRNREAQKTYKLYADLLGTLRLRFGLPKGRIKEMVQEHTEIFDALRARDEDRIEKAVRKHAEGAMNNMLQLMEIKS